MNYENKTIKEIINEIENNSEFIFFYLDKSIDLNRKVSINVKEQKIETILDQLFSNTENNYSISDRQIWNNYFPTRKIIIPYLTVR